MNAEHADNVTGVEQKAGLAARTVAIRLLTRVINDGRNLDALCDSQNGLSEFLRLEVRDQHLARAIVMTSLRNRNHIEHILGKILDRPMPKRAHLLKHTLHTSLAQILFMEVPDRAAVDIGVTIIGSDKRSTRFKSLANAVLRNATRKKEEFQAEDLKGLDPFPKWFSKRLRKDYGKAKSSDIASTLSQRPGIDISVKSNAAAWADRLGGDLLPTGGVRIRTETPVQELDGFEEGEWWVQDAAASIPAQLFKPASGLKVLELCAAPGGKTAQLANAGYKVTAMDVSGNRLKRLADNLKRLKLDVDLVEADILEWAPEELYDYVLLDAPCSSTGTIRRHPDVLWSRDDKDIVELANLQFNLLERAIGFTKKGGTIVFSNCSIFKEEGEDLLARTLNTDKRVEHDKLTPEEVFNLADLINGQGALRSLPNQFSHQGSTMTGGLDAFFACRLVRTA